MLTYLRTRDITTAPDTEIRVGHIIRDRTDPTSTLNADSYSPLSSAVISKFTQNGFSATRSTIRSGKIGVWAKLLENASIGAGAHASRDQEVVFTIETLETEKMSLARKEATDYIEAAPKDESLKRYLKASKYRIPVYLISGVKIARGAKTVSEVENREKGANASAILDGNAVGIPAAIGAEMEGVRGRGAETKIEGSDDFVFAYQVRKLLYSKRNKPVVVTDSVEGALFGVGTEGDGEEEKFDVSLVEAEDENGDDVEVYEIPGEDGLEGEICLVFKEDEDSTEDEDEDED